MGRQNLILVQSKTPPTVEIDTAVRAVYVRFKRADTRVIRTQQVEKPSSLPGAIVTIDFDKSNEVVGIELIGVVEFSVEKLLTAAQVRAPNIDLNRARYVGAGHLRRDVAAVSA